MRLEKMREAEVARRKGSARKTLIQFVWLIFSFIVAYFVCTLVVFNTGNGLLTYDQVYQALQMSRSTVKEWMILGAFMFVIVFFMQVFMLIGFFLVSYEGRRKPGIPSLHSPNKDPLDNDRT